MALRRFTHHAARIVTSRRVEEERMARVLSDTRFGLVEEERFQATLRGAPRALVAWMGRGCGRSEELRAQLAKRPIPPGWVLLEREVECDGDGPVGLLHGIHATPTVAAYLRGRESARIEGVEGVGIAPPRLDAWLAALT